MGVGSPFFPKCHSANFLPFVRGGLRWGRVVLSATSCRVKPTCCHSTFLPTLAIAWCVPQIAPFDYKWGWLEEKNHNYYPAKPGSTKKPMAKRTHHNHRPGSPNGDPEDMTCSTKIRKCNTTSGEVLTYFVDWPKICHANEPSIECKGINTLSARNPKVSYTDRNPELYILYGSI